MLGIEGPYISGIELRRIRRGGEGGGGVRSDHRNPLDRVLRHHSVTLRSFVLPSSVKSADFNQGTDPSRHVPYSAVAKDSKMPASPQLPPSNRSARSQPGTLPPDQSHEGHNRFWHLSRRGIFRNFWSRRQPFPEGFPPDTWSIQLNICERNAAARA